MELCNIGSSGILPSRPISGLRFSPEFPTKSRLPRLKRLNLEKNLLISKASGFDESCSGNGFYNLPSRVFMEEAIGAEYGEGFETFRPDGPLKVDVDFLNDRMQEGFLQRIRYAMKPDEAFGLIFSWDNVVADTRTLKLNAWKQLASEEGKDIPEDGGVHRSMLYAGADHVLRKVLFWEEEENELERLKSRLSQLYYENLLKLTAPVEGLKDWLDAVYRARIPCAIVSCLNRRNLVEALQQMGLNKYFQTRNATVTPPLLTSQKSLGDLGSKRPLPDTTFEIGRHPSDFQHLVHLLRNCGSIKQGRSIHGRLAKSCLDDVGDKKVIAFNHIAHMYAKHLDFDAARQVFDEMPHRNVFSWTIMISGLTDNGSYLEAFRFFCEMQNLGIQPDKFTFSSVFKLCLGLGSIDLGKMVHAQILKTGYSSNVFVGTSLLNMYAKFGEINEAVRVFNTMNEPSTVSRNAMLSGYVTSDLNLEAFNHFLKMKSQFGSTPDTVAFSTVLKAIGKLNDVGKGREVHSYVTELGLESNVQVGTALISMYSKCGCLNDARLVFDSNFTKCGENLPWNAMISGYSQCGHSKEALELFTKMCLNNVKLDVYTFASTVSAVAASECLRFVTEVHAMVVKLGYDLQCSSVSNALVDAYSRCGSLEYAEMVLEKSEERSLVFWTTMVTAHVKCSEEHKALQLFSQMREEGFAPNEFTFSSVLVGVSSLCLLEYGQQIHGLLVKAGLASHDCVEGALIDMYAKCGSIIDAEKVFKDIIEPDVVSWTAIISGLAQHGLANEALTAFRKMEKSGVNANRVTLLCLLFACSHAGMVEEGLDYFHSMKERYGLEPDMEHYTCIIDLLGRVGRLDDAEEFIKNMPFEPSHMIWQALLGACRIHGNVQLGERAARKIISAIPDDSAAYVLLSNTYVERGSLGDGLTLRNVMRDRGVKKEPGVSWITISGEVHKFFSGDQQHPDKEKIYAKLKELRKKMKDMGYAPDLKYFLQQIE